METDGFKIKAPTPESRDQSFCCDSVQFTCSLNRRKSCLWNHETFFAYSKGYVDCCLSTCAQVLLFSDLNYLYVFISSNRRIWEYININLVPPDKHFMKNNIWNVILSEYECHMNSHMPLYKWCIFCTSK